MRQALDFEPLVVPFGLILARIGALIASCPVFVSEAVPASIRTVFGLLLAGVLAFFLPHPAVPQMLPAAVLCELALGFSLGFSLRLVAVAVSFAGELFDTSLGFNFSRQINPMSREDTGPLMGLSQYVAALSFYLVDGHHIVIRYLAQSFASMPPGFARLEGREASAIVAHFGETLGIGLTLAMPLIFSLLASQISLALLARVAPQLNIWAIGFLAMSGLGLIALWVYTPAWLASVDELWLAPDRWMLR